MHCYLLLFIVSSKNTYLQKQLHYAKLRNTTPCPQFFSYTVGAVAAHIVALPYTWVSPSIPIPIPSF